MSFINALVKTIFTSSVRYVTYKSLDASIGHIFDSAKIDKRRKYTEAQLNQIISQDVKSKYGIDLFEMYLTNDDFENFNKIINTIEENTQALANSINYFIENKKIREFKSDIKRHNNNFQSALELWNIYKKKLENTDRDKGDIK